MKHLTEAEREIWDALEELPTPKDCDLQILWADIRKLLTTINDLRHEMNMQSSAMLELKRLREKCEALGTDELAKSRNHWRTEAFNANKELTKLRARNDENCELIFKHEDTITDLQCERNVLQMRNEKLTALLVCWCDVAKRSGYKQCTICEALAGEGATGE